MKQRLMRIIVTVLVLLLIPFTAMLITDDVTWTLFDFTVMGVLLFCAGLTLDLVIRKASKKNKIALILLVVVAFFLIWAELAVGIFNTPFAGN